MAGIEKQFFDLSYMDTLAAGNTFLHRIDPRSKLIVTLVFIGIVMSFDTYSVSALMPFFLFPLFLVSAGHLPFGYLVRKIIIVSPFALMVGIFNPFLDQTIMTQLFGLNISGGWISFTTIIVRFVLTVSAVLCLVALTGFNTVCLALEKIGVPGIFVVQLQFLYRYIFVLIEEASRMVRARALRTFHAKGLGIRSYGPMLGNLLLRTLDRAQRIHHAMCLRGFDGHVKRLQPLSFGVKDLIFVVFWCGLFVLFRFYNVPQIMGQWMMEYL